MDFIRKIIYTTIRDVIFCLCLLFLCFNPYADLEDSSRIYTIFVSFILYLLIPRIVNYANSKDDLDLGSFDKLAEQKENFIATLSHDLKTPALSQIKSIQLLLEEHLGALNTEQKNLLNATLNSCKYMKEMILTILATYKFKSGTVILNHQDFNVLNLVKECKDEIISLAKEKGLTIKITSESDNNNICADRIQIKRVILNLLSNAISYAYKNSEIKINIINDRGYFRFYIENAGSYIEDEILKQLFKRYSSFALKYKKASVGLGLYLSRKIIEAHLGAIKAESFIENKNIFSFYIPSNVKEEMMEKKKHPWLRF